MDRGVGKGKGACDPSALERSTSLAGADTARNLVIVGAATMVLGNYLLIRPKGSQDVFHDTKLYIPHL